MGEGGRYSRQVLFAGIGAAGQARLGAAGAALVGCGALGSVQADLLVRAGIGRLRIIDRDLVEASNLQRQMLFTEEDARQALPKAVAAERRLRQANSDVVVEGMVEDLRPGNAVALLAGFDLILDGTDNFETRFLVNDYAVREGRPWIYGACVGAYGVMMAVRPGETACLRCLVPGPPAPGASPTCDTAGVIGPVAGLVGAWQAAEALKILTAADAPQRSALIAFDLWQGTHQSIRVPRSPDCETCSRRRFSHLESSAGASAARLCGRNAVQVSPGGGRLPDLPEMARRLAAVGAVVRNDYLVRLAVDGYEITVFRDGRTIVRGTEDEAAARSVCARYLGG